MQPIAASAEAGVFVSVHVKGLECFAEATLLSPCGVMKEIKKLKKSTLELS